MGKNIFIVFAHNERRSFNGAILQKTEETLRAQGHHVVVSDLYAMNFNPVISEKDFKGERKDKERFNWGMEMAIAQSENRLCDDINAEQDKVTQADLIIFQFPMYWMGFPAIMKGWVDRVMSPGFAASIPDNIFDNGLLKGKKCLLSFTVGSSSANYSPSGPWGDMDVNLWPIQCGCFYYMGMDVLAPNVMYGCDPDAAQDYDPLGRWVIRLETVFDEKPLDYFRLKDYEPINAANPGLGSKLKDSVVDKSRREGPTTGQHLGMPLPPGQQTKIPGR